MRSSSRVSRAVWNGLMLTATGTAAVALALAVAPSVATQPAASSVTRQVTATEGGSIASVAGPGAGAAAAGTPAGSAQAPAGPGSVAPGRSKATPGPATAPAAAPAVAPAGSTTGGRMYIGSVAGGYQQALAGTGVPLANHAYAKFAGGVPKAAMITVSAGGTTWRDVAAAGPGSSLYNQIVTWAQTIKARGGNPMVAYNHEPEAHDRLTLGSAADFIAAYRHVETIFDQQGATNVIWTWQMTAYSFRVNPASEQAAAKWYPGDEWVDNVGADAYNWISCGATGTGKYNELQYLGDPVAAFARAHGKKASFPEFASHSNASRTQWLNNAQRYLVANRDVFTAAFYFNRPPTIASNADCRWGLTASSEFGALRQMAQDTANFTV
ncbi:MAG: domain containing protein [Blastococcus sp.]|jgi:hypothetical protein|nr:domain containing protein [Blastococcus sp.]